MSGQRKPGRRRRTGTPMPKTAITAPTEELLFFLIYSGRSFTVSGGIQDAAAGLVEVDPEAAEAMQLAHRVMDLARNELKAQKGGKFPTQKELWGYVGVGSTFFRLMDEAKGVSGPEVYDEEE